MHDGKHGDEIVHELDELLVARGNCLEVLYVSFSEQRTEIIGKPHRDDLIDNCSSCTGDRVELLGADEYTVIELQRLYRRT